MVGKDAVKICSQERAGKGATSPNRAERLLDNKLKTISVPANLVNAAEHLSIPKWSIITG
jgi:hypothetical protein